jgi:hypothetical protein
VKNSCLVIAALLISIMIAELISLAFIAITTKRLFYELPAVSESRPTEEQLIKSEFLIHPYFGYSLAPEKTVESVVVPSGRIHFMTDNQDSLPIWISLKPNNHGFWSQYDYPLIHDDKESFIVGIFGGSVAQWMAVQAGKYLEKELGKLDALEGKKIHVINMASGGFKQPQQLLVLSYFMAIGQNFDLVINLDGFNEVALPVSENIPNGIHYSMPRSYPKTVSSMTSIADSRMVRWLNDGLELRENNHYWAEISNQRLSASFYLLASVLHVMYQKLSEEHMLSPPSIGGGERSVFFTLSEAADGNISRLQKAAMVDLWLQSSILMHDIAERNGALYIHVLQPNQYHSKKTFSAKEKQIAIRSDDPYSRAVKELYPVLIRRSLDLEEEGINFVDATQVFDAVNSIIYADSCCHFNDDGNQLLVDLIVRQIERSFPLD